MPVWTDWMAMIGHINKLYMRKYAIILLFISVLTHTARAQDTGGTRTAVLLTGMVLDADTRSPMPYVNIQVRNTVYGTASDVNGYFSIYISPGDTLQFSSIGYADARFIMPANVTQNTYSLIQLMRENTIVLTEVVVFPWPSVENFKEVFLDAEPPRNMDDLVREVQLRTLEETREHQLSEYEADQRRYQRLYELNNIFPPNNFLNPMRWNQFIRKVTSDDNQ